MIGVGGFFIVRDLFRQQTPTVQKIRVVLLLVVLLSSWMPLRPAEAALLTFTGGTFSTGTPPFDSLDPGPDDLLVRNFDNVTYRYTYTTDSAGRRGSCHSRRISRVFSLFSTRLMRPEAAP
jgi:hypothetical protein